MRKEINDRVSIVLGEGRNVLSKTAWDGSGSTGQTHLLNEWNALSMAWEISLGQKGFRTPEPLSLAESSCSFTQDYFESAQSLWALIVESDDRSQTALCASMRGLAGLHQSAYQLDVLPIAQPETLPRTRMSFDTYVSLPVWGRSFIGEFGQTLDLIESLEPPIHQSNGETASFVHGDFTVDNILFELEGPMPIFIDWERAGLGSREHDLAAFFSSILVASYFSLKSRLRDGQLPPRELSEWIDSWQRIVIGLLAEYGLDFDSRQLRLLIASKTAARAYSKAVADGPGTILSKILIKIAEALLEDVRNFRILAKRGVIS